MSKLDAINAYGLQDALLSWFERAANAVNDADDEVGTELLDAICREIDYETDERSDDDFDPPRIRAATYHDAGGLTQNAGLVVRIGTREFQVTIVRSR